MIGIPALAIQRQYVVMPCLMVAKFIRREANRIANFDALGEKIRNDLRASLEDRLSPRDISHLQGPQSKVPER